MPIEHRPLTPPEMANADRLLIGLSSLSDAVERWNDLARPLAIPPIAIRFAGAPSLIGGEHAAAAMVDDMIFDNLTRQIVAFERKAA